MLQRRPYSQIRLTALRALCAVVTITCALFAGRSHAHVHVQITFANNQWRLFIYDFESGEYEPADVPLIVAPAAHGFVPSNAFTNFFGRAGSEIWTLPEVENPSLLFLGLGTSGIASGTFAKNQIRLQLRSLSGPGQFALYTVDPFGSPVIHMNSRDGIDSTSDSIALASVGGHVHVNWSFSAPGVYRVGLSASGRLASGGQTNTSPTIDYTFIVQDITWRPRLKISTTTNGSFLTVSSAGTGRTARVWRSFQLVSWYPMTNFVITSATQVVSVGGPASAPCFFRVSIE